MDLFFLQSFVSMLTCQPDDSHESHRKVYGGEKHEGKLSHELIAGAASFEAFKAFEDHQRKEGAYTTYLPVLSLANSRCSQANPSPTPSPRSSWPASSAPRSTS